ncbi:predicted protein [Micromonas commoda]|uniref:Uncharacterized protein n=1 Tax=Micromonas commoda (strain RCC299 / NOUM17 / CCMP2709) TaxID=296587 RepID=C1FEC2_MICCC|nr:predicted protein [Micromonas commoda]ACO68936.1 predicted protein [Micromonas commoda]|eukprot:XP_002507678.1 predicted protein [Micromonas commoda]
MNNSTSLDTHTEFHVSVPEFRAAGDTLYRTRFSAGSRAAENRGLLSCTPFIS